MPEIVRCWHREAFASTKNRRADLPVGGEIQRMSISVAFPSTGAKHGISIAFLHGKSTFRHFRSVQDASVRGHAIPCDILCWLHWALSSGPLLFLQMEKRPLPFANRRYSAFEIEVRGGARVVTAQLFGSELE